MLRRTKLEADSQNNQINNFERNNTNQTMIVRVILGRINHRLQENFLRQSRQRPTLFLRDCSGNLFFFFFRFRSVGLVNSCIVFNCFLFRFFTIFRMIKKKYKIPFFAPNRESLGAVPDASHAPPIPSAPLFQKYDSSRQRDFGCCGA